MNKKKNATVIVSSQENAVFIKDDNSKISSGGCVFGVWDERSPTLCTYKISLTRLISFTEVHSISTKTTVRIYAVPNLPLRLSANAGGLGVINMYLDSINSEN